MKKNRIQPTDLVGDKTVLVWNKLWQVRPGGFLASHRDLRRYSGLFRAVLNGETMVIGNAAGRSPGRLAKRIADFSRPSASARNHLSGRYIHEHLNELELQVLITGDDEAARKVAEELKAPMIALLQPSLNVPDEVIRNKVFG